MRILGIFGVRERFIYMYLTRLYVLIRHQHWYVTESSVEISAVNECSEVKYESVHQQGEKSSGYPILRGKSKQRECFLFRISCRWTESCRMGNEVSPHVEC